MHFRHRSRYSAALLLLGAFAACHCAAAEEAAPAPLAAAREEVVALRFDFEDGVDPVVAWVSNCSYTVNFKGLVAEQPASGQRCFKLDLTLNSGGYVYWSLPVRVAAEGRLRLAASLRLGAANVGRAGVGANLDFPPTTHSGCGPYVIEQMKTTAEQWIRREADLVAQADEVAASIAQKHVALATGENLGRVADRIGLFIAGEAGERVVVYLDDVRLEGAVPTAADYAPRTAARWAPLQARRDAAFAELQGAFDEARGELERDTYQSPGARFLAQRVLTQLPQWQRELAGARTQPHLRAEALRTLQTAADSLATLRTTLREVDARGLAFQEAILYALDDPTFGVRMLPRDWVVPARVAMDVRVTAAQGEIRAASLVVQALRDLQEVTLMVGDLTHESGAAALPADVVDVRVVKCWYQAGSAWHGIAQQRDERVLTPELLVHDDRLLRVDETSRKNFLRLSHPGGEVYWDTEDPAQARARGETLLSVDAFPVRDAATLQPTELAADTLKQYWLTVRTPESALPGTYTGTLTVASASGIVGRTTLMLRVLPFRLPMPMTAYDAAKPFVSSIYYRGKMDLARYPRGTISSEYKSEEQLRAELRDQFEHGIFNPTCYQSFEGLGTYLRLRDEVGMRGLPLYSIGIGIGAPSTDEALAELRRKVQRARAFTEPFGIRELYLYGIDEARGERLLAQRQAWQVVREAGAKSFVAGYKGHVEQVGDRLDLQVQANLPSREEAAAWHAAGGRIFSYANPQTGPENPELFRRNFGLALWLDNYDGAMTYAYQHGFGNIYDDFDHATYREHVFSYPTVDGVIPTLAIEGYREGINDIRYATLLKRLIAAHADGEGPQAEAAREADAWLKQLDTGRPLEPIRAELVAFILRLTP